ncbi:TPA: hypothetical protein ENS27_00190, partial [bacterium]|nr:hypothetical protein [bacterium]
GTDTWIKKKDMLGGNSDFATCVLGNQIYSFDGWSAYRSIQVYDPGTDTWKALTETYTERWGHTANLVNGKVYIIGGYSSSSTEVLDTVKEYDPFRAPKKPLSIDSKDKITTLWGEVKTKN